MSTETEIAASQIKKVHDGDLQLGSGEIKCFVIEFRDGREPIDSLIGPRCDEGVFPHWPRPKVCRGLPHPNESHQNG